MKRRLLTGLLVGALSGVITSACSSTADSAKAKAEARSACEVTPSVQPGQTAATVTYGQNLDAFKAAEAHASRAAAMDSRWLRLRDAYRTMVGGWSALVAAVGSGFPNDGQLSPTEGPLVQSINARGSRAATQAQTTIRSACASAAS